MAWKSCLSCHFCFYYSTKNEEVESGVLILTDVILMGEIYSVVHIYWESSNIDKKLALLCKEALTGSSAGVQLRISVTYHRGMGRQTAGPLEPKAG